MFRSSSSRPAFKSSSGNFPLSAVRSRLRSTDGVSQESLLKAAMRPGSKFSFPALDPCSDSPLLGVSAVKLDAPPELISGSPIFIFFKLTSGFGTIFLISRLLSTICCSILARHPAVRPYLSKIFCRKYTLFARLPLSNSSFCWIVGFCCVLLPVASHGLANTQTQELQIPSIITFPTSHTACLHCTCWRQQQKFIGAVKLADKNSSHPPHVQLASILRMVSPQAHFSKWHNFSSVVLAPESTIRRSPGSLPLIGNFLQLVHSVVSSSP